MKDKNKIECDAEKCEKRVKLSKDAEYPYKEGWVYLHRLDYKHSGGVVNAKKKHFCTPQHFKEFVENEVKA